MFPGRESALIPNLKTLLSAGALADVKICVGSTKLPAHKAILAARSDVFRAMFEAPMVEAAEGCVKISGFSLAIVKGMLEHIYTDSTEIGAEDAGDFLAIADFYNLETLKCDAAWVLCANTTLNNIVDTLRYSNLYNYEPLKIAATACIVKHKSEFISSSQFHELTKEELAELFVAIAK